MLNTNINITALSVMTSCGCNLNCSYCRIAQSVHEKSVEIQKNTIQALQDGSFLKNINSVLNRLNQSTSQIQHLAFWGQEPTLTLKYITENIQQWFEYFPNWSHLMFSTNTIANMDKVYDFIVALENNCKTPFFNFILQCSYDGDYGTTNLRQGSSSLIYKNIKYLIEKLNETTLNKVHIQLVHHGVLSLDLLEQLQTPEAIVEYSNHMAAWGEEFKKLNRNKNIELLDGVDIALETPVEANSIQGLKLNNFCEIANRLNPKLKQSFNNLLIDADPIDRLYMTLFMPFDLISSIINEFNFKNLHEILVAIQKDPILKTDFYNKINNILYCGNAVGELKIMYDGTLVNCQNHIYETKSELIHDNNKIIESIKKGLADHQYFVNGITDSDDVLNRYFDLFNTAKQSSFEFIFQNVIILMKFLSITGQIDSSYRDQWKLIEHSFLLAILNCCSYNNQIMTGSLFMRHTGHLRFMCNGYLDKAIDNFNNKKQKAVF